MIPVPVARAKNSNNATAALPEGSILVAAGVLFDQQDRVLLQQRHPGAHQGGWWEFPGGKVEPGESNYQALCRELREELGIRVDNASRLLEVNHDYEDRVVMLDVWLVHAYQGQPQAIEAQPLRWVRLAELPQWPMPAADLPIIEALLTAVPTAEDTSGAKQQPGVPILPGRGCSQ
jgi:8-oxo-dGTP diphosphatase